MDSALLTPRLDSTLRYVHTRRTYGLNSLDLPFVFPSWKDELSRTSKPLASIASGLVREQSVTSVTQSSEETPTPAIGAAHTTPHNKCDCDAPSQSSNKVTPDPHPSPIPLTHDTSDSRKPRGRLAGISSLLRESSRTLGASLVEEQKTTDLAARGETYDGPYLNGQRHGDGVVCTFADGSKFLGSYRYDEPSEGTLICQEFTYTGTFAPGGKFHGSRGKLAKSNGSTYEGEFRNSLYHGSGKMTYPDSWSIPVNSARVSVMELERCCSVQPAMKVME